MKARFAVALLAVAILCASAMAQEKTAGYWLNVGHSLMANGSGSFESASQAFDKAIQIDPVNSEAWLGKAQILTYLGKHIESLEAFQKALDVANGTLKKNPSDAVAWQSKGIALTSLDREDEADRSFEKSIDLLNGTLKENPRDAESWWLKAENLDLLGKSEAAIQSYDMVIELNSTKALGAWIRKADLFISLGKYNESADAFDSAIALIPGNNTSSVMSAMWKKNIYIITNAWFNEGRILRVTSGWYNESSRAYENIHQIDSSFTVAWQSKGRAVTPQGKSLGEKNDALMGLSLNWAMYGFTRPKSPGNDTNVKEAEDWHKKGLELEGNGSYEEAIEAYNRAIELEPHNATFYIAKVPSLNMLAIITNNQSKRNESLQTINKALQIDPKNPSSWELKGEVFSQMKRYNESLEAYDKAVENIGSFGQDDHLNQTELLSYIWTSRSISLWQLMRYNESLEAVDKAVQIDPTGNFDAWAFKGQLLTSLGRYNESLQAFDKAAAIGTANNRPELEALPWIDEGYVLMQMGRYEEADQIYEKIIGLNLTGERSNRQLADAWWGRGNALASLGKYNESLQAFDRAIELNSEKAPYAWTGKGDALLASGRYDEAIIAYDRALKLYPEFADAGISHAQKGKGDSLTRLGKREEALAAYGAAVGASDRAITAFNNATSLDKAVSFTYDPYPLDQTFWNNRGSVLKALGRRDEASQFYEKALEAANNSLSQNAQDFKAYDNKGKILFELGRYDESIQVYDQFIETNPGPKASAMALVWKGKLLFEMGRADESLESLNRAAEIDPPSSEAWRWKAGISAELGRYEDALQAYNETLQINGRSETAEIWQEKGGVLKALGRQSEADAAFAKAKEMGYKE